MAKRTITPTPVPTPHTRALLAFEQNLDSIIHMLRLSEHEVALTKSATDRAHRVVHLAKVRIDIATKSGQDRINIGTKLRDAKLVESLNHLSRVLETLKI